MKKAAKTKTIKKLLVANRGAIAERIFATCREMGIRTCAIAHEQDRNLSYTNAADEVFLLEGESLAETYLNGPQIISLAKKAQVDAIHPGYGFLSENATFADQVQEAGLIFVGPSSEVMNLLGNKMNAKRVAEQFGVPTLPGYHGDDQSLEQLTTQAKKIGFPLLIKAAAGGGGKGMRVVERIEEFGEKLEQAKSEAQRSFSNDKVLLEKFLVGPKHIEVQMICDSHGNYVHLFERDCSVQRRHQKVIEEAPAPTLSLQERNDVGQAAVRLCAGIKYENAATVEFIYEKGKFYFLEVNTRLQVEHGVTELVTGVDIVREQIRIAQGDPLSFSQADVRLQGSALQVRLYAEDPFNHFFPSTGKILYAGATTQKGVRLDASYRSGDEVTTLFDPMIAKVLVVASDREQALHKMREVLKDLSFLGVKINLSYLAEILEHPKFIKGDFTTNFLNECGEEILKKLQQRKEVALPQEVLQMLSQHLSHSLPLDEQASGAGRSPWEQLSAWY